VELIGILIVSHIALNATLDKLPYAKGASWDPGHICLPHTRDRLLEDIWTWITATPTTGTAEIYWLTGVAGSGKTAISHSVAQHCSERKQLVSCFFFDRKTSGLNDPQALFSTIAYDLCKASSEFAEWVALAIEQDRSLASCAISRQFKELILRPSHSNLVGRPFVIVIDALDEGCTSDLLDILSDGIPQLPPTIRIFLTSRMEKSIVLALSQKAHVHSMVLHTDEQTNQDDVALYIQHRFKLIAAQEQLDEDWPGPQLLENFTRKAEGLFLWVATFCDYLCGVMDPTRQLELLSSGQNVLGIPAEEKMDRTYIAILGTCNWRDVDFVQGYSSIMGAIMAVKTPLSISALQVLHGSSLSLPVTTILWPVRSLLTSSAFGRHTKPATFLHQSFYEFITIRARASPESQQFSLSKTEHSQRLALLCLEVLNIQLKEGIPGAGYLSGSTQTQGSGIPQIGEGEITEELWYACRFWIDHLLEVKAPLMGLVASLQTFLLDKAVLWMEVLASRGQFRGLAQVQEWSEVSRVPETIMSKVSL
jgi:hypothetical protein